MHICLDRIGRNTTFELNATQLSSTWTRELLSYLGIKEIWILGLVNWKWGAEEKPKRREVKLDIYNPTTRKEAFYEARDN